jgi:hypothetical protein
MAGVDGGSFAHGVRDKDIDDAFMGAVDASPATV